MERRRFQRGSPAWVHVRGVIVIMTEAYTLITGLVLWDRLACLPTPWRGSLFQTVLVNWGLTMVLLFTIRLVVLTRLVQPTNPLIFRKMLCVADSLVSGAKLQLA